MTRPAIIDYVIRHQQALLQTDFARELWMVPDRFQGTSVPQTTDQFLLTTNSPLYVGKLFIANNKFWGVTHWVRVDDRLTDERTYKVHAEETKIPVKGSDTQPLCTPQDSFALLPGEIVNYTGDKPLETTLGRFVANHLFLVYPFGDTIPYLNETFNASKLEKRLAVPIMEGTIKVQDVKDKYVNTLTLFGQSTEMLCPNISEKTITIPESINKLRDKLVKDNQTALEAGDASVMSGIEKQLITAYKEYLQGDSSLHFLLKEKYFTVILKKLFLTHGMVEVFGSPGKFTFITQPLGKGWKVGDLPAIFNEVRAGSFARAVETADGGVIAKLILRVLQDTRITEADCQTTQGEVVHATKDILKDFIWNYIVNTKGDTQLITEESLSQWIGKTITIRTPGYCASAKGFCAKCFGKTFEELGQKALAPVVNDFARAQTVASLKKMHGTASDTIVVQDLNRYLI